MLNLKSVKTQLIIFLSFFALYLFLKDKDIAFLLTTLIAVISAALTEGVILFFRNREFKISESSIISGLIVGYVLSAGNAWWVFVLAAMAAILSKYLIRFKKRHIFNPAAFGIFLSIILFNAITQWKGAYVWQLLLLPGLYFIYQIRKTEILLVYILTSFVLFGVQAGIRNIPLNNIPAYLNYFFIFIMLVEPQTTPVTKRGKFIFGAAVAAAIFIFNEIGIRIDAEISALLLLNLAVSLLNRIKG